MFLESLLVKWLGQQSSVQSLGFCRFSVLHSSGDIYQKLQALVKLQTCPPLISEQDFDRTTHCG